MFWKKDKTAKPEKQEGEKAQARVKPPTPRETLIKQIEQLNNGKSLGFRLPKDFGDWQLTVELNPRYPEKGKKYQASREDLVNDAPSGKKFPYFDTNEPREIADWVLERKATLQ